MNFLQAAPAAVPANSPMEEQLFAATKKGDIDAVRQILIDGVNVNARNQKDEKKKTAILSACSRGYADIVELLLDNGADGMIKANDTETTAMHHAAKGGNVEVGRLLLKRGYKADEEAIAKWQPIHYASLHAKIDMIDLLLDNGASVDAATENESTSLLLASRNFKSSVVRHLLKRGADANLADKDGGTPVNHACRVGALSIVKILVEEGNADPTLADKSGSTALDEADKMNMWECALYVWQKGCESSTLKKAEGVGPVQWIRPRIENSPTARYSAGATGVGNKVYLFGGNGLPEGYINHDPDCRLNETDPPVESTELNDFWILNMDSVEHGYIVPLAEKPKRNFKMSDKRIGEYLKLHDDKLTVESVYQTCVDEDADPSSAQAEEPFVAEDGFGYFEAHFLNEGTKGIITLGLTDAQFVLNRIPGWVKDTYGYHGDDGQVFHNNGQGKPWGPRYNTGDIIGCGINFKTGEVFFTKNGEFLGVAYQGAKGKAYYATVGFRNPLAKAKLNFGATPFKFDFSVPILKWISVPVIGNVPAPCRAPKLHQISEKTLLLLGDFKYTYNQIVWTVDLETYRWKLHHCKGTKPLVMQEAITVVANGKLYAYIHATNAQYLPRDLIPKLPALYELDTFEFRWRELLPRLDGFEAEEIKALQERQSALDVVLTDHFPNAALVSIDGKLVFLGEERILFVDPSTFEYQEKKLSGANPNTKFFSTAVVGKDIEIFGGWDERRQVNEVHVLDTTTAQWYKPHVSGCVPRPRNHHSAITIFSNKGFEEDDDLVVDTIPDDLQPSVNLRANGASKTYVVHAFGWNGRNFMDDTDILSLNTHVHDDDLGVYFDSPSLSDLTLRVNDTPLHVSKVVLAARSTYFRSLLHTINTNELVIPNANFPLFKAMIRYLYTDTIDYNMISTNHRDFVQLMERFAPEHVRRITEELLLTRVSVTSTLGTDLAWASENPLYSDVTLEVEGNRIPAHRAVICARSAYFQALCTRWVTDKESSITLPDTSFASFRVVLQYLYTKEINVEEVGDNIISVFELASRFDIKQMKSTLETIISYNLADDNVASLLLLAEAQGAAKLRDQCCKYITENTSTVSQTQEFIDDQVTITRLVKAYQMKEALKSIAAEADLPKVIDEMDVAEPKLNSDDDDSQSEAEMEGEFFFM